MNSAYRMFIKDVSRYEELLLSCKRLCIESVGFI